MDISENSDREITLDESVALLMSEAPAPVRRFLAAQRNNALALSLASRYGLHTDQAGELERGFVLMLLGAIAPEEFVGILRDAGIEQEKISGLVADVNRDVFMPLREEERQGSPAQQVSISPPTPKPALPMPVVALPEHDHDPLELPVVQEKTPSTRPASEQSPPRTEKPAHSAQIPQPPLTPPERPDAPAPKPEPMQIFAERKKTMPSPPPNLPGQEPINRMERVETVPPETKEPVGYITHTMSGDMTALKEGKSAFEIAHPTRQPEPSPPPIPAEPQKPEPLTTPPTTPPQQTPPPQTPAPSMNAPKQEGARPPAPKSYGADPYREPIE